MKCTGGTIQGALLALLSTGALGLLWAGISEAGQTARPPVSRALTEGAADIRRVPMESADAGGQGIAARDREQKITVSVSGRDADGARFPAEGIVCDNLRETPSDEKNCLSIDLPASFSKWETSGFATNQDGAKTDLQGHNNVGIAIGKKGRLIYYPPDEFNSVQEPQTLGDLDGPAARIVLLHIRVRAPEGDWRDLPPTPIVLARPPVILIHGINASPDGWAPFAEKSAGMRAARSSPVEFPFTTLDHNAPCDWAGANFRDRVRYPYGLYAGCGPVEIAAALLSRRIEEVLRDVRQAAQIPFYEEGARQPGPAPFVYHRPDDPAGKPLRLAIRRVDIVAHSYGGVIARWYLASQAASHNAASLWYRGRYTLADSGGKPVNLLPAAPYRGNVRKLITLGSMWRGVPLSNYVNEIRFSDPDEPGSLSKAPIRLPAWMSRSLGKRITTDRTAGGLIEAIDTFMKVRTPAAEVMAVNSPWMRTLIYGARYSDQDTGEAGREGNSAQPFREDVAYGSVAGDNSRYLHFEPLRGVCLPGVAALFQQPPRFPFIALEHRGGAGGIAAPMIGGAEDYTDGLVPLWSALIPGSAPGASRLVHTTHGGYFTDKDTLEYVARWLNNAALPTGKVLRSQWDTPIFSGGGRKRWLFQKGSMAPISERGLYACVAGIGRLAPDALYASRSIEMRANSDGAVTVEWNTPAGGHLDRASVYEGVQEAEGTGPQRLKRVAVVKARGENEHWAAVLPAIRSDRATFLVAEAVVDNSPDPPVRLRSERIPILRGPDHRPGGKTPGPKPVAPIRF